MTADAGAPGAPRFDVVLRGYDRRQVDEHVARLQRVLARMRADLEQARSQPHPAGSPGDQHGQGARPRPTPRQRPGMPPQPGQSPDMIGSFTDRMQSILQAAEEEAAEIRNKARNAARGAEQEAAEIRNKARTAARAEEERLRAQLADLVRQRDVVLAELTRMRGQLEGMLAAPTARISLPPREPSQPSARPRDTTASPPAKAGAGQPASGTPKDRPASPPAPRPNPVSGGPTRSASPSRSGADHAGLPVRGASEPARSSAGDALSSLAQPTKRTNGGGEQAGRGPAAPASKPSTPSANPSSGPSMAPSAHSSGPSSNSPGKPPVNSSGKPPVNAPGKPPVNASGKPPANSSGKPPVGPPAKPSSLPAGRGPAPSSKPAAHRLPTGAYPAVPAAADKPASLRPRTEPQPEPADLFRPSSDVPRDSESRTTSAPRSGAGDGHRHPDRPAIVPASGSSPSRSSDGAVPARKVAQADVTVKVSALNPPAPGATVLTPSATKPPTKPGEGAAADKQPQQPPKKAAPSGNGEEGERPAGSNGSDSANRSSSSSRSR